MFARVITAQTGSDDFNKVIRLAQEQLPSARERPGFHGYYLLANDETGKMITISLWETREHMEAVGQGTTTGIHDQGIQSAGLTSLHLETYEVTLQA